MPKGISFLNHTSKWRLYCPIPVLLRHARPRHAILWYPVSCCTHCQAMLRFTVASRSILHTLPGCCRALPELRQRFCPAMAHTTPSLCQPISLGIGLGQLFPCLCSVPAMSMSCLRILSTFPSLMLPSTPTPTWSWCTVSLACPNHAQKLVVWEIIPAHDRVLCPTVQSMS